MEIKDTALESLRTLINGEVKARERVQLEVPHPKEFVFHDTLTENESAVDLMGDDKLKLIAHELIE